MQDNLSTIQSQTVMGSLYRYVTWRNNYWMLQNRKALMSEFLHLNSIHSAKSIQKLCLSTLDLISLVMGVWLALATVVRCLKLLEKPLNKLVFTSFEFCLLLFLLFCQVSRSTPSLPLKRVFFISLPIFSLPARLPSLKYFHPRFFVSFVKRSLEYLARRPLWEADFWSKSITYRANVLDFARLLSNKIDWRPLTDSVAVKLCFVNIF